MVETANGKNRRMSTVNPTGLVSEPLYNLALLIAQSASFQAWTGTATGEAAIAQVFIIEPDDGPVSHPFAALNWDSLNWQMVSGGASAQYTASGRIGILLEQKIEPAHIDLATVPTYAFANALGGIIADILSAAGQSGTLIIQTLSLDHKPERVSESWLGTAGDYYQAKLTATWGLQ